MSVPRALGSATDAAVAKMSERWIDTNSILHDAVSALGTGDRALFLAVMAFLATRASETHRVIADRVINAALALALGKPRLDILEWLDDACVLYTIDNIAERVVACQFPEVHLWFQRRALDAGAMQPTTQMRGSGMTTDALFETPQ